MMYILSSFTVLLAAANISAANPEVSVEDSTSVFSRKQSYCDIDNSLVEMPSRITDTSSQSYDSIISAWHEQNAVLAFDRFFTEFIDIDPAEYTVSEVPDSVYEARLKMIMSPMQFPYNHIVKSYLIAYTTKRKVTMSKILGRAQSYFPLIEEELDREGLPLELRMLPVVESALSPTAVSRAGATGLWQFMYGTGRMYGLEVTSFVDQRRDPIASTKAACKFLKELYRIYGDWSLALAAYNCGPGNVNKALSKAGNGATSFWDIYDYLPRETRGYIPSFIAANYAYHFHRQHGITPEEPGMPLAVDTLMVSRPMHFEQISSTINTPVEVIRQLNPQYKQDIIPATGKSYSLTLPQCDICCYLENEETIHSKDTVYLAQYLKPSNIDPKRKEFRLDSYTYKVKSGDTLGKIASNNNVSSAQIIKWNNLKNPNKLSIGQKLEIFR